MARKRKHRTPDEKIRRKRAKAVENLKEVKKEFKGEGSLVAGPKDDFKCIVCGQKIRSGNTYRRLMPDEKTPEWRHYHYPDCGPGTEAWFKFHPSRMAQLMMQGKEVIKEKRLSRREKRLTRKRLKQTQIEKGEIPMSKKAEKATKKAGAGKRGEHLKPMEPVIIPESVVKKQSKEVQVLLKELTGLKDRSSSDGVRIRKGLRKAGFKLSDYRKDDKK
jgi:hypothetical protein